jgi:ribose transport system ATP-binding protein
VAVASISTPAIEVVDLSKRYPGVLALDRVSLQVQAGEIEAIVGENGAGKSTFLQVLAGLASPESGEVRLHGRAVRRYDPQLALREYAVALVPQELVLCLDRTVAQNVFMGAEPGGRVMPSLRLMEAMTREILHSLRSSVPADARTGSLGVADRQLVVIARALARRCRILVLDEPTTLLTPSEVEVLFEVLRRLRDNGTTIVYVSHRLPEVFTLVSRIHVMRDGRVVYSGPTAESHPDRIVGEMVGTPLSREPTQSHELTDRAVLLGIDRLTGHEFREVSLELRRGELLGILGLPDSGRGEFLRALFGAPAATSGSITLAGQEIRITSPAVAIRMGFGYVPSERRFQGIVALMTVAENLMMVRLPAVSRFGMVRWGRLYHEAGDLRRRFLIKCRSLRQAVQHLSGGNQQKVILARWLAKYPNVLLLDEPTRGIDVGAKREIYGLLRSITANRVAIVISSSEVDELLRECDRIAVMRRGRLVCVVASSELTEDRALRLSLGVEGEVA